MFIKRGTRWRPNQKHTQKVKNPTIRTQFECGMFIKRGTRWRPNQKHTQKVKNPTIRTQFECGMFIKRGTRWRSLLRHCATPRKIAVSIPDGVIGSFHNNSGIHNDPGVDSVSNRNEYQDYFLGIKAAGA